MSGCALATASTSPTWKISTARGRSSSSASRISPSRGEGHSGVTSPEGACAPRIIPMVGHSHHAHDHRHEHGGNWPFALGMSLNLAFVGVEVVFGLLADSTALLADAGHNLGDVLALGLAWGGRILAGRLPSRQFTYGLRGSSILAALFNAMLLMLVTGAIAWEAVQRLQSPVEVASKTVIIVALCGILVNG